MAMASNGLRLAVKIMALSLSPVFLTAVSLAGPHARTPLGPPEFYWLLNRACSEGDALSVEMLLRAGADPTGIHDYDAFHKSKWQHGYEPSWPINVAADGNHLDVARLLLAGGATIDAPEDEGQTALMLAAFRGHLDMVKLLLESGADKNYRAGPGEFEGTAEDVARRSGHDDIARFIQEFQSIRGR